MTNGATPCTCLDDTTPMPAYSAQVTKLIHRISLYYTLGTILVMALLFSFFVRAVKG